MIRFRRSCAAFFFALASVTPVIAMAGQPMVPAPASAQSSQDPGTFSDVPADSWAFDAVQQLSKDGIVKGVGEDKFDGKAPLTRYQMAVIIARAEAELRLKLLAGDVVSKADLEAIQRLESGFARELALVESDIASLKTQQAATTAQVSATSAKVDQVAADLNRAQFHYSQFIRVGAYNNNVTASNGATTLTTPYGVVGPKQALPAGLGPTSTGLGAGVLSAGPNTYVTGNFDHGTGWQYIFPVLSGSVNDHFSYFFRLELRQFFDQPNALSSVTPSFCTTTTPPAVGGCGLQDYGGANIGIRLNKVFMSYTMPGGLYMLAGRYQEDEGRFNTQALSMAGYSNGVNAGFTNKRWDILTGYGFGDSALGNLELNGAPLDNSYAAAQQNLFFRAEYNWNERTVVGALYDNDLGYESSYWNPSASLCRNAANTATAVSNGGCSGTTPVAIASAAGPVTGAYETANPALRELGAYAVHYFGRNRDAKVTIEGETRRGNDPFTNRQWVGASAFEASFDIGAFSDGSHRPRNGGNWIEGAYFSNQLNSLSGSDTNLLGANSFTANYLTSVGGYQGEWLTFQHYFAPFARVGIVAEHLALQNGVTIPLGSLTCPGCFITSNNQNILFLTTNFAF